MSTIAVCRVCTANCNAGISLKETCCSPAVTYLEAFNTCTALDAAAGDEYPQSLCPSCSQQLQTAYDFICKARHTDNLLRAFHTKHENEPLEICEDPLQSAQEYDVFGDLTLDASDVQTEWFKSEEETQDSADSDDDEDNTPLKYLLPSETFKSSQLKIRSNEDLLERQSVDDDHNVAVQSSESTLILPQGEQIFPQGLYQCTECDKHYFTNAGLEAHNDIHLPKGAASKTKRVQRPRKKASKNAEDNEEAIDPIEQDQKWHLNDDAEESTQIKENPAKRQQKKPPKPKKLFPCHVCGKHMISASKLRYHSVMHTGQKDFLCTICPKAYSTIYALKHHIRTHTGERPYECKFCGDKFLRPTTLKSHMRRHTGERPYGCSICGKRFIQHSSMTTHMKLNHMAKTIQCPHCDKKYARQTDLNTHLLSHTGNKPFSCTLCPSRFIRQANLNKHLNQQHFAPKPSKKIATQSKGPTTTVIDCKTETMEGELLQYSYTETPLEMATNGGEGIESSWDN